MNHKPKFKSVRLFVFNSADWNARTESFSKEGQAQIRRMIEALKAHRFKLLYICTKPGPESKATAWQILDRMGGLAQKKHDEISELRRSISLPNHHDKMVEEILASEDAKSGKRLIEKGLSRIAQSAIFNCLYMSQDRPETAKQDVLVVADNCWLELASLEPQSTPFGLKSGQGMIYTLQTTWQVPSTQPKERINVRSTVVECEPIGWSM